MKTFVFILLALAVLIGQQPNDAGFADTLQKIDERSGDIRDLRAKFVQLKHTAMLKKPMRSEGTLRIKVSGEKALMRWDTAKPHASTLASNGEELQLYYPSQSLLEMYPLESELAQLAASPLPRLEFARKHFTIEELAWPGLSSEDASKMLGMRLTPLEAKLREHVLEVRVLIDRQTACVTQAVIEYPDAERLEMLFTEIRLNEGVTDEEVELKVPPGTRISHPLEPGARSESAS